MEKRIVGLIPARAGSKRVPNKNIRLLNGHPMLAYTIAAALQSGVFDKVIVSTESEDIAEQAKKYGAEVPFLRPQAYAEDASPDIEWITHLLKTLKEQSESYDCFSILRPTSPFRQASTIRRAWEQFCARPEADSLRAVEKCNQHPAKMWRIEDELLEPIMKNPNSQGTPWHSTPYQALPPIYVQNASLEIAHCAIPLEQGSIAGKTIIPFITEDQEGFDINLPEDWFLAEYLISNNQATLPQIQI